MKKIVFFIETKKPIGGSQIQFLDFAAFIAKHFNYETYYINHKNSVVENLYENSNIHFIDVNNCDYSQFEEALFFTPVNYLFYLLVKIKNLKSAKICLYFYHPNVFDWLNAQIYINHRKSNELLQFIYETNSYCFMDSSNYYSIMRQYEVPFSPIYLPVTLHMQNEVHFDPLPCSKDVVKIGWLGRLDGDKVYSIVNAADNLMKDNGYQSIDFHIIGDGNAKNKIPIEKYSPKIRFIFTSYMYGEERDRYIYANVDLAIAMGISAIDVAMLNIPTLIPIVSPKPFWNDVFVFIQDINDYSLGWNREDIHNIVTHKTTIQSALDCIYQKNLKEKIAREGREFCINTFSIEEASKKLIDLLENSGLTIDKCLKNKAIKRQLDDYNLYKKLNKNYGYMEYHEFIARFNRAKNKTLSEKLKLYANQMKKYIKRKVN